MAKVELSIESCHVSDNSAKDNGGGICCWLSTTNLEGCEIARNSAKLGAGCYFYSDSNATLEFCSLTENKASLEGGAIYALSGALTLLDVAIKENFAENDGGGICCWGSTTNLERCEIIGNLSRTGAGCYFYSDYNTNNTKLHLCTLTENIASGQGGAIYSSKGFLIVDKVVANANEADSGGAIAYSGTQVNLVQSRFCGNRAKNNGGALYSLAFSSCDVINCVFGKNYAPGVGGGICCLNYTKMKNSILWENVAKKGGQIALVSNAAFDVDYCDVQGGQAAVDKEPASQLRWGKGNIDVDPLFVDPGHWGSKPDPNVVVSPDSPDAVWIDGDYHLQPNSPCINAGDPNGDYKGWRDIDDRCRVVNAINMGIDEEDCFPAKYSTYPDWILLGAPDCWCAPSCGEGYQCDGDADGKPSPYPGLYRVFNADLQCLVANWKKPPNDPNFNPCCDFDHKAQGIPKYRVFTNDLNILVTNWKKKDRGTPFDPKTQLPGDCPRSE
jgi:predicted outer membrane repeat protein